MAEREFTAGIPVDLAALREFIAANSFDHDTAIWSTLDYVYDVAAGIITADPRQSVSIVLMTDGLSNTGLTANDFIARHRTNALPVPTYVIRVGDADPAVLVHVAMTTGGHVVNADTAALATVSQEIHGCL